VNDCFLGSFFSRVFFSSNPLVARLFETELCLRTPNKMNVGTLRDRERASRVRVKKLTQLLEQKQENARRKASELLYDKVIGKRKRRAACWADPLEVQNEEFEEWQANHKESQNVLATHQKVMETLKTAQTFVSKTDSIIQEDTTRRSRKEMEDNKEHGSVSMFKDTLQRVVQELMDPSEEGDAGGTTFGTGWDTHSRSAKGKDTSGEQDNDKDKDGKTRGAAEVHKEEPAFQPNEFTTSTSTGGQGKDEARGGRGQRNNNNVQNGGEKNGMTPATGSSAGGGDSYGGLLSRSSKFRSLEGPGKPDTSCMTSTSMREESRASARLTGSSTFRSKKHALAQSLYTSTQSLPPILTPHAARYCHSRNQIDMDRRAYLDLILQSNNERRRSILEERRNSRIDVLRAQRAKYKEKFKNAKAKRETLLEDYQEMMSTNLNAKLESAEEKKRLQFEIYSTSIQQESMKMQQRISDTLTRKQAVLDFRYLVKALSISISEKRQREFQAEVEKERLLKSKKLNERLYEHKINLLKRRSEHEEATSLFESRMSRREKLESKSSLKGCDSMKGILSTRDGRAESLLSDGKSAKVENVENAVQSLLKKVDSTCEELRAEGEVETKTIISRAMSEFDVDEELFEKDQKKGPDIFRRAIRKKLMRRPDQGREEEAADAGPLDEAAFGAMLEEYLQHGYGVVNRYIYENEEGATTKGAIALENFEANIKTALKRAKLRARNPKLMPRYKVDTTTSCSGITSINV